MKHSKSMALLLVMALFITVFTGCSNNAANDPGSEAANTPPDTGANANGNAKGEQDADKPEEKPSWQNEKITLKFAGYEDAKIMDGMIKGFMEKYPNITVVRDEKINWPWNESLATAASANDMPDVFWLDTVSVGVENDWLLDLSPYWNDDPETEAVYPNIAAQAKYNGKRFAAAGWQVLYGVYLNKTLFEKNNVALPSYDWTIDEMLELAKKLSNPDKHYYGISGAGYDLHFEEYWPMANDPSLGYNTFDGEKFHFTNQEWIDAFNKKLELQRVKTEDAMTPEERGKEFGNKDAWAFQEGHVAMATEGSWTISWLPAEMKKTGAGDLDFYPYPAGKTGQKMPALLDYIGVSSTTKHPEAAYALMKWMSWGRDGWLKRLELYGQNNNDFVQFPIADYPEVWEKIEPLLRLPGQKAVMKLLKDAVPSYNKTLLGLAEYEKWFADNKFPEKFKAGEFTPADKAKELEDKANEFIAKAKAELSQ
ncbi:ABC transporter substrate-binding protein [Paenibacillus solisilvae]|uniref:ABC transporter substrate-binding protein n=1 Tax=Paenibacillus solisilvae TaxID=2486751 RepID=A0ABW0VWC9_9BACL